LRAIVTGGGTGGHIYPALAIAKGIREKLNGKVLYVGTSGGMEADIVPREGLRFETITAAGLKRSFSPKNLKVFWQAGRGISEARKILSKYMPDAVIGTGGYVCGPVVLAAAWKGIPTLIHEQNALPGITNRILSRFVRTVAVTFPDSIKYFRQKEKVKVTGLPVRPEILASASLQDKDAAPFSRLGLDPDRFLILSFGGSRGALSINRAMLNVIKELRGRPGVQVLHITGRLDYESFLAELSRQGIELVKNGNITVMPYLYNMQDALAAAGLVICRAGAATIAEITVMGLPSILIPYPYAAENHQEYNARALARRGAAELILDRELTGEVLMNKIRYLLETPGQLQKMGKAAKEFARPQALQDILNCIENIIKHS